MPSEITHMHIYEYKHAGCLFLDVDKWKLTVEGWGLNRSSSLEREAVNSIIELGMKTGSSVLQYSFHNCADYFVFCYLQVFNIIWWGVGGTCQYFRLPVQSYILHPFLHPALPGNLDSCFCPLFHLSLLTVSLPDVNMLVSSFTSWLIITHHLHFQSPIHSLAHFKLLLDLSTSGF